jgi:hypothetical protein
VEFAKRIAEPLREPEPVGPGFEARLLDAVRAAADQGEAPWATRQNRRRALGWLTTPRRLAMSPLAGLALAAGFATLVAATTIAFSAKSPDNPTVGRELVHFAIVAPTASSVTLVGDFNGWNTTTTPMTKGAVEGLWMVTLPLDAGSYQYAFVIDGSTWVADPAAPVALEDEFGAPSSIVRIQGGRS